MWMYSPGNRSHTSPRISSRKRERALVPRAVDVEDRPDAARRHREGTAAAGKLGVGGQGGQAVARHLDLGDDGDEPALGVGDDLADLVLGVETSVGRLLFRGLGRPLVPVLVFPVDPPGAHLGQLGVLLDLDPPALVVREVPVEGVHLMENQKIDVLQHEFLGEEMPRTVEHHAPPGKPRGVLDVDTRQGEGRGRALPGKDLGRQKLEDSLSAVQEPRGRGRLEHDAGGGNMEPVGLTGRGRVGGFLEEKPVRDRRRSALADGILSSGCRPELLRQVAGHLGRACPC